MLVQDSFLVKNRPWSTINLYTQWEIQLLCRKFMRIKRINNTAYSNLYYLVQIRKNNRVQFILYRSLKQ